MSDYISIANNQNTNDNWVTIEPGHDRRPKVLLEFKENVGSLFPIDSCSTTATSYNEMLPDSLFEHIVMCTNARICPDIRRSFSNIDQGKERCDNMLSYRSLFLDSSVSI